MLLRLIRYVSFSKRKEKKRKEKKRKEKKKLPFGVKEFRDSEGIFPSEMNLNSLLKDFQRQPISCFFDSQGTCLFLIMYFRKCPTNTGSYS